MSDFKVTTSVLMTQSEQLLELNTRYKSHIDNLVTSEGNLNSMWDGEANEAFHAAFENDKVKMFRFAELINEYAERLKIIAENYEKAEQANTEIASSRSY